MDPQVVQNLRYKLQKRVRRLNSVEPQLFIPALRQFWAFFDQNPTYSGIARTLSLRYPEIVGIVDRIFSGEGRLGENEEEAAALGQSVLRRLVETDNYAALLHLAHGYSSPSQLSDALEVVRDVFLEPFYEYVDESLDDQRAMLALLLRYKHRSEWFHRLYLWRLIETDPQKAEKSLALDLYAYLHDQGIDFTIEPSSITGEVDLIAAQGSSDPLLADAKIFDAAGRAKGYIRKAFSQIYTYTQQHNEPFGYLIIFKTTDKDLRFSLSTPSRDIPIVVYNHKTIFLITVDIFPHPKPVSQRDPLHVVDIKEEELVAAVEEGGR